MSFCPSCGAQNADDARFCNRCGTAIGAGTTRGAAAAPASPPPAVTTGNVTLGGIGIQSPRKTYAILALGALAFLALGAGMAWIGMHGAGSAPVASTVTTGEGTSEQGDGVPVGVDVPDDDFVMTSGARVVKRGDSAPPRTGTGGSGTDTPTTPPPSTGTTGGGTTRPSSGGRPPSAHPGSSGSTGSGSTGSGSTGSGSTGSTGSGSTGTTDPAPSGGGTAPPPGSSVDWDAMSGTVADEEPDYQMQMYSTQVRRFIRQYLLPQATSCFEHASATSRDPVRGTVAIGFDINARGHAESATVDRNTTGNDALARCLQNNVNSWQLPPPPEGAAPIQMQMPFTR